MNKFVFVYMCVYVKDSCSEKLHQQLNKFSF